MWRQVCNLPIDVAASLQLADWPWSESASQELPNVAASLQLADWPWSESASCKLAATTPALTLRRPPSPGSPASGALLVLRGRRRRRAEQFSLALHHGAIDHVLALVLDVGQLVLDLQHDLLDDGAQPARPRVARPGPPGDLAQRALV